MTEFVGPRAILMIPSQWNPEIRSASPQTIDNGNISQPMEFVQGYDGRIKLLGVGILTVARNSYCSWPHASM
jgi:hypothetical protein